MKDLTVELVSMSSLEIAKLTGKRHADVIKDIEKMLDELDLAERILASGYKDTNNQERKCYNLDKEYSTILVSGYSIKLRAAIVKRWIELEASVPPLSPLEIAQLSLTHLLVLERKQLATDKALLDQSARISELEINQIGYGELISIKAYCNTFKTRLTISQKILLGKSSTKFCKDNQLNMGKVHDQVFGEVNTYPVEVITEQLDTPKLTDVIILNEVVK